MGKCRGPDTRQSFLQQLKDVYNISGKSFREQKKRFRNRIVLINLKGIRGLALQPQPDS